MNVQNVNLERDKLLAHYIFSVIGTIWYLFYLAYMRGSIIVLYRKVVIEYTKRRKPWLYLILHYLTA